MQQKRLLYLISITGMVMSAFVWSWQWLKASTVSVPPAATGIVNLQNSDAGVQFTLQTAPVGVDENGRLHLQGLDTTIQQPGAPALPYFVRYIALPPAATATVTVTAATVKTSHVPSLPPAPTLTGLPADEITGVAFTQTPNETNLTYQPDPAIYQTNALYPDVLYTLSEPMYYRDVRLVALTLYPVRYNPVTGQLTQVHHLSVTVQFAAATQQPQHPAPAHQDAYWRGISTLLLNETQARQWRSLPQAVLQAPQTELPIGVDSYKIELSQDGIYEISYQDLAAAGMTVTAVNPHTFQMLHRGEPVAYQFIGDSDTTFEPGEKVRFYGWAFTGPRTEKQFISRNVFWLWAGGTPNPITTTTNLAGELPVVTATLASVTTEPENYFFSTWTDKWENFPNEPDAWYWDYIIHSTPVTRTYAVELPHVAANGPDALYTIELMSREAPASPAPFTYTVRGFFNSYPAYGEQVWRGGQNVNITNTIPLNELVTGSNTAVVAYVTDTLGGQARLFLNRVTVDYLRDLIANDNQLIFQDEQGGLHEFHLTGYSEGDAANVLVWNITDPHQPVQIEMTAAHISGSSLFTYTIGSDGPVNGRFLATTTSNILTSTALSLTQYIAPDLNPPGSEAEWLAITHANFLTPTQALATHRANFSQLTTHIVDIADVINQYGYGLPLPAAIQDYLTYALGHWVVAPSYVLLVGDATLNPRHLNCVGGCFTWDVNAPTYLLTDLVYEDRFQGLIPSDHTFVTLSGDDVLPDMAIGRIATNHPLSATNAISKIMTYEQNLHNTAVTWSKNSLFVADNADDGGDFCTENLLTGFHIPDDYVKTYLCLLDPDEVDALRAEMSSQIHVTGTLFLNYRGHGSIQYWMGDPHLLDINSDFWSNNDRPVVILSADCLDGHFAWPGAPSLSETFFNLQDTGHPVGSAAHWSSSGLGYTGEHTVLLTYLYDGVFRDSMFEIGNATNDAKLRYDLSGLNDSELYSFILQGDPAMVLILPFYRVYLPILQN